MGHSSSLVRRAFFLEWVTVGWMIVEGAVAIVSSIASHSMTLLAFGIDSLIELLSAGVLLWRLNIELQQGAAFSEQTEQRAAKIAGALLLLLASYVALSAVWALSRRTGEDFSLAGLIVALVAIPAMFYLSKAKIRLADAISSRALRADAMESLTCGYLSLVVVAGLIANAVLHAWWVDSVTSLAIVYFLIKEGREAWLGETCGDE